jgi:hypothetical protein
VMGVDGALKSAVAWFVEHGYAPRPPKWEG